MELTIEDVFSEESAISIADIAAKQCETIFDSSVESWKVEASIATSSSGSVNIYSSPILINRKGKGVVMKFSIEIEKQADSFFDFLTSIEGYKFLDPDSNADDFNKPIIKSVQNWNGRRDGKVQAEYAHMKIGCATRDFVVMNAFNYEKRRWYSVSELVPSLYPGHTKFTNGREERSIAGRTRIGFVGCYAVDNTKDENKCILTILQWIDMGGYLGFMNLSANKMGLKKTIQRSDIYNSTIRKEQQSKVENIV